ncbi:sodium-dependent transporter [Pleurocapsa sp. PCC 7319]|uniref:sodium-dependent transporter n=1 Tax=Pleurocapsa sp. PCC 7319 TaxID=118161 RepID=UPI00034BBC43|nr:sodium-dependent transporter [Pleurocapsa sp. PCC 7319]
MTEQENRKASNHWRSSIGFIAAAAGSAVGLGNIWKFPYITGQNGGGTFVLFYLLCIVILGLPIMVAEVMIGRTTQSSPVRAFQRLSAPNSGWQVVGMLGVFAGILILSFYSIVAGWGLHYLFLSIVGGFPQGNNPQAYTDLFDSLVQSVRLNIWWHSLFMGITIVVVLRGIRGGIEKFANWGMLALLILLGGLAVYGATLPGFLPAVKFLFAFSDNFTWKSALEALGHAFFSLSLGIGVMLTYGSYLQRHDDVVGTSIAIAIADTIVAIGACLVLFPIAFSVGLEPSAGPGLIFINIPLALLQLPWGRIGLLVFFVLLLLAALTSAVSLLEMAVSFLIDSLGWSRTLAASTMGGFIYLLGIPSALSGGSGFFGAGLKQLIGMSWFDAADYLSSNWLLPLGGIGISLFIGWRLNPQLRTLEFQDGSRLGSKSGLYSGWLLVVRWLSPIVIVLVMLYNLGFF